MQPSTKHETVLTTRVPPLGEEFWVNAVVPKTMGSAIFALKSCRELSLSRVNDFRAKGLGSNTYTPKNEFAITS